MNNKKRVLLGMSGGVDSSVAAILLKQQGYEVIGATMKLLNDEINGTCCNIESTLDAKKVCHYLQIPHYTLNFCESFNKHVIQDFKLQYENCKTPNPCIECNKYLKFGEMFKVAKKLDCNYIATGHYAKVEFDTNYNRYVLKKSNSIKKDQSYVLYNLPTNMLKYIVLPLGNFKSKDEIRAIAKEHNLDIATKSESQDICFIPNKNYKEYLKRNFKMNDLIGDILNIKGEKLGEHTGLYNYTIGQRKGLNISYKKPLYVIGLNKNKNQVIVDEEKYLYKYEVEVKDFNFLLFEKLEESMKVSAKIRYSAKEADAIISPLNGNFIKVKFDEPQRAVTPGQSIVFYLNDVVIGGGKII